MNPVSVGCWVTEENTPTGSSWDFTGTMASEQLTDSSSKIVSGFPNPDGQEATVCDEITTADGRVLFKIDEDEVLSVYIRSGEAEEEEWGMPVVFDADELWGMVMPDAMIAHNAAKYPPDC